MTTEPPDIDRVLDAVEEDVDLRRSDPGVLRPQLATLLLSLQGDSKHRPRVHRLLGVIYNRLKLDRDALRELREAKTLAEAATPPNYTELAKIGRETAVVYSWRGDDRSAALELLPALAYACLEGEQREVAKIVAEFGRIEYEARRFKNVVRLLRRYTAQDAQLKLPENEARRMRINLCQALNQLGKPETHEEVLQRAAALRKVLPEDAKRLSFLTRLEEMRANAGLGRMAEADRALDEAEALLPESESAFEHTEYLQAKTELQEIKGGPPAVESIERLIDEYSQQQTLVVREAMARRALANALVKRGENDKAREALSAGLRRALKYDLVDLAIEIRADMLKSAGADHLEEMAEAIDLIGGVGGIDRRYIRLDRLGKGGAGEVFRAIDLEDGQHVALKKLQLRGLDADRRKAITNTIKTEYAAAGRIDDPRVARVLDLRMTPGGALYIVQRYVDGPTLRKLYDSGAKPARLLGLLARIAEALSVLHAKHVVHRDLKPANVIVTTDARGEESPVLIDLGIALVAGRPDELEHFGTLPYVAPEQVAGGTVDARADIYALGQMIAEIWGGKVPARFTLGMLRRESETALMPRAIRELVREMLRKDPANRTNDLRGVAEALRTQRQQMEPA